MFTDCMSILEFIYEMIKVYFINRKGTSSHFSHLENHCHYNMQHHCRRELTPLMQQYIKKSCYQSKHGEQIKNIEGVKFWLTVPSTWYPLQIRFWILINTFIVSIYIVATGTTIGTGVRWRLIMIFVCLSPC